MNILNKYIYKTATIQHYLLVFNAYYLWNHLQQMNIYQCVKWIVNFMRLFTPPLVRAQHFKSTTLFVPRTSSIFGTNIYFDLLLSGFGILYNHFAEISIYFACIPGDFGKAGKAFRTFFRDYFTVTPLRGIVPKN